MDAVGDLDENEDVNANCILMANLQQASISGTQTDKALVFDSDGSSEVQLSNNCYNNDIFNMFTQEEQYIELLNPIPEPHQVQQNDSNVISEDSSMEHLSKEKSTVSSLLEEKKRLKSDLKIRKDELVDKQIQLENKIKINPSKNSREDKFVPINKVRASVRTNPITVSQSHVITKKDVNSDTNGFSSTRVNITVKTRRPQPRSNTMNDRVPSESMSSCIKNKEVE
ncbi:hypothetical protein Tco_1512295, partial [Tanacetum coccineum]